MKKSILVLLSLVIVACFAFVACSPATPAEEPVAEAPAAAEEEAPAAAEEEAPAAEEESGAKKFKIGVSIMELTAYTWFQGVIDGCNQWAADNSAEAGVELEFVFEDSRSDVQTMLTNIENMVAAGCDGIILSPADASSAIPLMKKYTAEGIPFVVVDYAQDAQTEEDMVWSTFVGHDMRALGEVAGAVAVDYLETLGKEDPVCVFITRPTSGQVSIDRFEGFKDTVLATFPNATIVEEGDTGAGNRDSAQTLMENVMQRETVIDVVSGHNDALVVGAYNAAVAQGNEDIKFIGIAGDIDVLGWIEEGNAAWAGEVLQDPVVLGYQATDAMVRVLANGETLPEIYDLPDPEAITPANISEYDWKNWGWLG